MKIKVEHEVPYTPGNKSLCLYAGDFWGNEVCRYHTHRDRTHGSKAPIERKVPKCMLFDEWLPGEYIKCEKCRKAIDAAHREEGQDVHTSKPSCHSCAHDCAGIEDGPCNDYAPSAAQDITTL